MLRAMMEIIKSKTTKRDLKYLIICSTDVYALAILHPPVQDVVVDATVLDYIVHDDSAGNKVLQPHTF